MAVMYCNRGMISRGTGGNAVASAAYRHATKMKNEVTGIVRDYSAKKDELVHEEIVLPSDAPEWAVERYGQTDARKASELLWNDIEARENQHNRSATSRLAESYTIALPAELSRTQNIELVRGFTRDHLTANGSVADIVIHDKGDGNPHAHIMATFRTLGKNGLDKRIRNYVNRDMDTVNLRFGWACSANYALEKAGFEQRIDHRRLEEQGIELGPLTYNHEIAANVEVDDRTYRIKQRVREARMANGLYLMERPAHMLTVVGAANPVFTEDDIADAFVKYLPTDIGKDARSELFNRAMRSGEVVQTGRVDANDKPLLTTRANVAMGELMEAQAVHMSQSELVLDGAQTGKASADGLSTALSDDQRRAAEAMISPTRLTMVTGYAGTGKTFTVKEASKVWKARGFEVLGGAVNGKAAQELSGIDGQVASLAQWEARWSRGIRPTQGKFVFIMDEAGMVGTAIWSRVQTQIEAMGGKLIALGDVAQLAPILDTSAWAHLLKINGDVVISEVRRQVDAGDRLATQQLSRGGDDLYRALDHYNMKGAIAFEDSIETAIDALAKDHFDNSGLERIALAHRNVDVAALNARIREQALAQGVIDHKSQVAFERKVGTGSGDVEIFMLGVGDRVRFTSPLKDASITKSSFATVVGVSPTQLRLSVDERSDVVEINAQAFNFNNLDRGFAATVHKSQGMSVKGNVSVLITGGFDSNLLTVALTRHEHSVKAYVPKDEISDMKELFERATRTSLLDVAQDESGQATVGRRLGVDLREAGFGVRVDMPAPLDVMRYELGQFEGDAHLTSEAMRVSGLLRSSYEPGMMMLGEDPRGYGIDPLKVVDDLLAQNGVLRASDVADQLANVVKGPETFTRLFAQAMSHPDLVILSETGMRGEGRIYSSLARVEQSATLQDRGVLLACTQGSAFDPSLGARHGAALGFDNQSQAGLDYMLWPSRLAVLEEVGSNAFAQASGGLQAVLAADGATGRVLAVSSDRTALKSFGAASGVEAIDLYALGRGLAQKSIVLGEGDVLIVPEASGLHVDELDVLVGMAEQSRAKLVLHHDPSLEGAGSVVRHLSQRIETCGLGGLTRIGEGRRGIVFGGDYLKASYEYLDGAGLISGAVNTEAQKAGYVARYLADTSVDKVGVAGSQGFSHELNVAIEAAMFEDSRIENGGVGATLIERTGTSALPLHKGSVVRVVRERRDLDVVAGARGTVVSFSADGGMVARFGDRDVSFSAGEQAAVLDYGHVLPIRAARGYAFGSVHGFANPGLRKAALTGMLQQGDQLSLSLPVDVNTPGAGAAFLAQAMSFAGERSVLDYGFDPSLALRAAADRAIEQAGGIANEAPSRIRENNEIAVQDDRDVYLAAHPSIVVAGMARQNTRFNVRELERHIRGIFPIETHPDMDIAAYGKEVIAQTLQSGTLLEAGRSSAGGDQQYVSRVQVELEARIFGQGKALAASHLSGFDEQVVANLIYSPRARHVIGSERLSFAQVGYNSEFDRFMMEIGAAWRERGYQMIATETSSVGAKRVAGLLGEGAVGASLSSLEAQWAMGRLPEEGRFVVVMSGAERVDSQQWGRVQERIDQMGGKLISVGRRDGFDFGQSVNMHQMLARACGVGECAQKNIQEKAQHRSATHYIRQTGEAAVQALDVYNAEGSVYFAGSVSGAHSAIVRSYWSGGYKHSAEMETKLAIAHSGANTKLLDGAIRSEGERLGRLGERREYFGRSVNIGEVLTAARALDNIDVQAGDRLEVVGFKDHEFTVKVLGRDLSTDVFSDSHMAALESNIASTIYAASTREVDHSFVYATRSMDQQVYGAAMTRHRKGMSLHVSETEVRDYERLSAAVQRNNSIDLLEATPTSNRISSIVEARDLTDRADFAADALMRGGDFGMDAHLQTTVGRVANLLSIGFEPGDAILGHDPHGYASDPMKVVDDLLAERSVIRADDVARSLARVVHDPETLVCLFAQAMDHPDLVILSETGNRGEGRVYSSLEHIRREVALVDKVSALALDPVVFVPSEKQLLSAMQTEHGPMSPDQERALRHATSANRMAMITGYAGSGKSTVLKGVREVYERNGWNVVGTVLDSDAARGLSETAGIKSYNLAALKYAIENKRVNIGPKTVLVVDEAGKLNAEQHEYVLELVERTGASVRLVGDPRQLQPRGPGAMWRSFEQRIGTVELDTIWRQRDPQDRIATRQLAAGGVDAGLALDHFMARGMVKATGNVDEVGQDMLFRKAVEGYMADPYQDKDMLTHRVVDVARLNHLARSAYQESRDPDLPVLAVPKKDGTLVELQAGDKIAFQQNRRIAGIVNGDRGVVVSVNPEQQSYTARLGGGMGTDEEARFVTFSAENTPKLDYGYARTVNKSQGATTASTHFVATRSLTHSSLYVGASRYQHNLSIYTPTDEASARSFLGEVAKRDMPSVSTVEQGYAFETAQAFEAVRQARSTAVPSDGASDLNSYIERHDGPRRPSMMPASLERLFSIGSPEKEGLQAGADTRAVTDVINANVLRGGPALTADVQNGVMRTLQDVSAADSWNKLRRTLPRDVLAQTEQLARMGGKLDEAEAALPEARAFTRAIAVSKARGDDGLTRTLTHGFDMLNARVQHARSEGAYGDLLEVAHKADAASRDLMPKPQPIQVPAYKKSSPSLLDSATRTPAMLQRPEMLRSPAPIAWMESTSQVVIAKQVIRALIGEKGPGFFETFEKEQAMAQNQNEGTLDMDTEFTHKQTGQLTPLTEEQEVIMAEMFSIPTSSNKLYGDDAAPHLVEIGGGTLSKKTLGDAVGRFAGFVKETDKVPAPRDGVPLDWHKRLFSMAKDGASLSKVPVESKEEWVWALSESFRIGSLATDASDIDLGAPSKLDWANDEFTSLIADTGKKSGRKIQKGQLEWKIGLSNYMEQSTQIDFYDLTDVGKLLEAKPLDDMRDNVKNENVAVSWKERFLKRIEHRNEYEKHPKFESLEEFEWATKTLHQQAAKLKTGALPGPNDLVKMAERKALEASQQKGLGLKLF